ncbi:MAG: ribokinase [Rhodospirillales bacterium]|nr:ribokinase [Rhodospirillales bacterium]
MTSPMVLVAGSLHYDVVVTADRLPGLDETLPGRSVSYLCGGKGGNQAIAAALHGVPTAMAGRVGDDAFGRTLLDNLGRAGVDRSRVAVSMGMSSGMSVAIVTSEGDYGAVIVSAANLAIDAADIQIPRGARVVLLQNEIPETANAVLAEKARDTGAKVILNAAPARPFETAFRSHIDLLIVNRFEATMLCGHAIESNADAIGAAGSLAASGCDSIVTLGGGGVVLAFADGEPRHFPALRVQVHSTHGAGDVFAGALAARSALGADLHAALDYAQVAAALHVSCTPDERASITTEMVLEMVAKA